VIHVPKFLGILFFVFTLAVFGFAQTTPKPTPTPEEDDGDPIKIESKLVVVPVSVSDAQGQPVSGLKIADFRLLEENKQQQLDQLSTADEVPLEIAVLLDVSASTDPMYQFEQQTAAQFLKEVMKPGDRASVITIGESPYLALPLGTADAAGTRILSLVTTKSYTAFFDSVSFAAEYLQKNGSPSSRKVIIVISDGEDNFSKLRRAAEKTANQQLTEKNLSTKEYNKLMVMQRDTADAKAVSKVMQDLQNADTVFYSVNPAGNSYQLNTISQRGQSTMQKFADDTGGTAFLPRKAEDLSPIFRRISSELRAQYLLQYYAESTYAAGKYINLQVSLPGKPQLKVRARQGYYVK
jgi:Ca-activated chloride channel family protein